MNWRKVHGPDSARKQHQRALQLSIEQQQAIRDGILEREQRCSAIRERIMDRERKRRAYDRERKRKQRIGLQNNLTGVVDLVV